MDHYLPSLKYEHGGDMDSSFSSVASSDFSGSPASTRTSATSIACHSPPSRPASSIHYGLHGISMNMSPHPPLITQDYVHVPSAITQGYVHMPSAITQDYVHVPSQSNGGCSSGPHYRDSCPAPAYFPLHHSLPDFSTSAPFIAANHGYHVRGTESPSAMSIWSYDAPTPPFFESPCPSPVSAAGNASMSPTPSPRAFVRNKQRRRTSPKGTRGRKPRRVATTAHGIQYDVIPASRYDCKFPGCGNTYARPEHLKRHEKNHDENATIFTCELCLDLMPPDKVHRVKNRLDNFIMHVKNHTDLKGLKTSAAKTKFHPGALAYLRSLEAQQKNRGRGTRKPEDENKL
ncbi:hypothetical protein PpBr36_06961 [Pyricularia pennisetigena]|uniref:hypothetical protein n=1 Tax=Pyricularia pennisetigena TaxID=1578925 RepID=UPI00115102CF|nr:hypothetical protein PpBr36_06961 [Pyricularia pennisetigena]TLS25052.1 hypothetical protein PpBr36_06961 [Pyricularia pennisetigena]